MKKIFFLLIILNFSLAFSAHIFKESYYQEKWCSEWQGILEYKLNDDTRVDCLTKNYAVEFDFAPKWAESVGQSLYYASETNKKPGIVIILEKDSDIRYYKRAEKLARLYNIQLWNMKMPKDASAKNYQTFNPKDDLYKFISQFLKNIIDEVLKTIFA